MRTHLAVPHGVLLWILILAGLFVSSTAFAKYDDVLFLVNGDRISGDVKELSKDLLRYKTDSLGTIYVPWEDVQSLETEKYLRIELKGGRRVVGSIGRGDAPEQLTISTRREDERHQHDAVVAFIPLKLRQEWFDRIEGGIKFGLNGTKGSETFQWNLGANALYREENWELSSRLDSTFTDKSDNTNSERISFFTNYRRLLSNRWFWSALVLYDRNDELGIQNRYSAGGGAGRFVMRSNSFELMFHSGLLGSREFRVDTAHDQLEGYVGGSLGWFKHRFPKTDIRTDVLVLPSLTDSGRIRTNWDISIAREIITDLSLDLSVYYSTDNQAPDEASGNDWGITTGIEYAF